MMNRYKVIFFIISVIFISTFFTDIAHCFVPVSHNHTHRDDNDSYLTCNIYPYVIDNSFNSTETKNREVILEKELFSPVSYHFDKNDSFTTQKISNLNKAKKPINRDIHILNSSLII